VGTSASAAAERSRRAYQLGTLDFAREQYEQAEPLLRQVYEAEPSRPNLGYDLGFIEYRKKHYRGAIDLFQANVPSNENFPQLTRFYAGLAMAALGFPARARAEVEEALRLQPISPLTIPAQRFGEALARAAQHERRVQGELRLGSSMTPTSLLYPVPAAILWLKSCVKTRRRTVAQENWGR
jgi:tetratricopeptide (TPR) repeat protein